jgi:hypothetical protein
MKQLLEVRCAPRQYSRPSALVHVDHTTATALCARTAVVALHDSHVPLICDN